MRNITLILAATAMFAGTAALADLPNDRWSYQTGGAATVSEWTITNQTFNPQGRPTSTTWGRTQTTPGQNAVNPGGQRVARFNTTETVSTQTAITGGNAPAPSDDAAFTAD